MAPTIPHVLMTVHGGLPAGESWSCGLRSLATAANLGDTKGIALAVAVANRWRVFANSTTGAGLFGNTSTAANPATIDGATVRRVDEDGVTVEQFEGAPTTALVPVADNSSNLPNQCAVVVSLITARAGRTGRGRIYLPCMKSPNLVAGRIGSGTLASLLPSLKILFDGLNTDLHTATDAANYLAVQSSVASAEPGVWTVGSPTGYMGAKILTIKVGDVVDDQRRRRASIRESYSSATLA